jgi:hypothetical protein
MDHLSVDSGLTGRFKTMGAEAQTEQVGSDIPKFLKVALVVVAVAKAVKVKRLREDS